MNILTENKRVDKYVISYAPLPEIHLILSFFSSKKVNLFELSLEWHSDAELSGWLSRSAWSLLLIAIWRKIECLQKNITVWVPDYFCNASLTPLRKYGVNLVFYPITSNMEPNEDILLEMAKKYPVDIFILTHYWGIPKSAIFSKYFCSKHGSWLIEDAAHVLRPIADIGKNGDFILYSPHKLLPIPDGALLVVCPNGANKLGDKFLNRIGDIESWFKLLRTHVNEKRIQLLNQKIYTMTWLVKRLLQKAGLRYNLSVTTDGLKNSNNVYNDIQMPIPEISIQSARMLKALIPTFDHIAETRRGNQKTIDKFLSNDKTNFFVSLNVSERANIDDWAPYLAAYKVDSQKSKAICERLRDKGIPALNWPDLPYDIFENEEMHGEAIRFRENRIYIPCHQSIKRKEILTCLN